MVDPGWNVETRGRPPGYRRGRGGGLAAAFPARLEPVLADLAVERPQSDAEHRGGPRLVPAGVAQRVGDEMSLGLLDRHPRGQGRRATPGGDAVRAAQGVGQIREI